MILKLLYSVSLCVGLSTFAKTGDTARPVHKPAAPPAEKTKTARQFSEYPLMRLLNTI